MILRNIGADQIDEKFEYFTIVCVSINLELAKEEFIIDLHIKDAFASRHQAKVRNQMLIAIQNIVGSAHGTLKIVSRRAVCDVDAVFHRYDLTGTWNDRNGNISLMKAIVVYESLTGTTKQAGEAIAAALRSHGWIATTSPMSRIDLAELKTADVVIVGSWTDGVFFFGQKPAKESKLASMLPMMQGKTAAVYCTYAIDPGKTLPKLGSIVRRRGGDVVGGYAIHRKRVDQDAAEFALRLLTQVNVPEEAEASAS